MTDVGHPFDRWQRLPLLDRLILRLRLRRLARRRIVVGRDRWVPGELIVSLPADYAGWDALLGVVIGWLRGVAPPVGKKPRDLLSVEEADDPEQWVIPETRLNQPRPGPLARRYVVLRCPPGLEAATALVLRAYTAAPVRPTFWPTRRRRNDPVLIARSSYLRPAAAPSAPGSVVFTDAFTDALARGWLAEHPSNGSGASVVMLDFGYPDDGAVGRSIQFGDREYPERVFDGHATMVAAAIAKLAPQADLTAYRLQHDRPVGSAELLRGILRTRSCDLMVSSTVVDLADKSADARAERSLWINFVQHIRTTSPRPMLVFPTGNDDGGADLDRLAIPAGCPGAIAVGSIDPRGQRSVGSRTNARGEDAPEAQWMVPGGSFPQLVEGDSLILVNDRAYAGTSVSAAFAAGMLACLVAELRAGAVLDPRVRAMLELAAELENEAATAGHTRQAGLYGDGLAAFLAASELAADPIAEARSRTAAVPQLAAYDRQTWGEGVLRVLP